MIRSSSYRKKDFRTRAIADTNIVLVTMNVVEFVVTDVSADSALEE
jgi:hypothetical protein